MIEELVSRILARDEFNTDYRTLLDARDRAELGLDGPRPAPAIVERLLQCAVHFSSSKQPQARTTAYEIAAACRGFEPPSFSYSGVRRTIFERLGNFPAANLTLAAHQDGPWPLRIAYEVDQHRAKNTKVVAGRAAIALTDSQVKIWDVLAGGRAAVIVAPTSAGKTFAMQHFALDYCHTHPGQHVAFLVPSRALISELAQSLGEKLQAAGLEKLVISTVPVAPTSLGGTAVIYVITQERLQFLFDATPELRFGMVVVDEAHMLGDGARGILLQRGVEQILARNPETGLVFGSALVENPDIFRSTFQLDTLNEFADAESMVSQRLVYVARGGADNEIRLGRVSDTGAEDLGILKLPEPVYRSPQSYAYLCWHFGKRAQNLVYAPGPAECERIAGMIASLSELDGDASLTPELDDFARFLEKEIHSDYALATAVRNGVAFHYGNMPAVLRIGIEELFAAGHLRYLVCTSTLLHGVNLPARNLFIQRPAHGSRQQSTPLSGPEFWNLAGRAGRMGKDFEGFVYLIDYEEWPQNPALEGRRQTVQPAFQSTVVNHFDRILTSLTDQVRPSEEVESALSKLLIDFREKRLESALASGALELPDDKQGELYGYVAALDEEVGLPTEVLAANPAVSPVSQQRLLEYMLEKADAGKLDSLVPAHPLSGNEPYERLLQVFKRIHTHFEGRPSADGSHKFFAAIALSWMRGASYSQMIEDMLKHRRGGKRPPKLPAVIRSVFQVVEQDLRFRFVKFTKCYLDVLRYVLNLRAPDIEYKLPAIPLYLELGASSDTMVNLVGLGLSRTTAAAVGSHAPKAGMARSELERWLNERRIRSLDIPEICRREVSRVLRRGGPG